MWGYLFKSTAPEADSKFASICPSKNWVTVQLSQIAIEKFLAQLMASKMNKRLKEGTYKGKESNAICHFFGYQTLGYLLKDGAHIRTLIIHLQLLLICQQLFLIWMGTGSIFLHRKC